MFIYIYTSVSRGYSLRNEFSFIVSFLLYTLNQHVTHYMLIFTHYSTDTDLKNIILLHYNCILNRIMLRCTEFKPVSQYNMAEDQHDWHDTCRRKKCLVTDNSGNAYTTGKRARIVVVIAGSNMVQEEVVPTCTVESFLFCFFRQIEQSTNNILGFGPNLKVSNVVVVKGFLSS